MHNKASAELSSMQGSALCCCIATCIHKQISAPVPEA